MRKNFLIIFVLIGLLIVAGFKGMNSFKAVDLSDNTEIDIEIPEGSSLQTIAKLLKDKDLIKSEFIFKIKAKQEKIANHLQAGEYFMSRNMSLDEIIAVLKEGPIRDIVKFTIPEGYELRQTAERLSEMGLVDEERFLELVSDKSLFEDEYEFLKEIKNGQSLEGFLFPATYEVYKTATEEEIISRMLDAFNNIYKTELIDKIKGSELSFNEIITLASIIEREGKLDKERPLMSAVFYNRIEQGIRLQSCATVQYILGERKPVLSNKDTSIPSPYNTYLHEGLPPAPIAAPGKSSLIAALEPADVDYLYFVLTGEDGSHTFTTNYKDHLKAKNKN